MSNHHKNQRRREAENKKCQGEKVALFKDGKYVVDCCLNCAKKMKEEYDSYDFRKEEENI